MGHHCLWNFSGAIDLWSQDKLRRNFSDSCKTLKKKKDTAELEEEASTSTSQSVLNMEDWENLVLSDTNLEP